MKPPRIRSPRERFYSLVSDAVADIETHGFDSEERVQGWSRAIELAARAALVPERTLQASLKDYLQRAYKRALSPTALARSQPGVQGFTVELLKPRLRAELDRRIVASANLIKLNREASIQRTMQRFSGWATSVPAGGTRAVKRSKETEHVRRGIAGLPFEERRVVIDQAAKLNAALNEIIALDGGAISFVWHHVHNEGPSYTPRPEHLARDKKIFVIRDNWALARGLMKLAGRAYYDTIDAAGEKIFCRCWVEALYTLRDLPREMLTERGLEALKEARSAVRGMKREESHVA